MCDRIISPGAKQGQEFGLGLFILQLVGGWDRWLGHFYPQYPDLGYLLFKIKKNIQGTSTLAYYQWTSSSLHITKMQTFKFQVHII